MIADSTIGSLAYIVGVREPDSRLHAEVQLFAEMQDRSWARRPPFIRFTAHLMQSVKLPVRTRGLRA